MLTDEIRASIGRTVSYPAPEALGHTSIRHFALALGGPNPLYRDEHHARAAGNAYEFARPVHRNDWLSDGVSEMVAAWLNSLLVCVSGRTMAARQTFYWAEQRFLATTF